MLPNLQLLDLTRYGRQETWGDSPAGWPEDQAGSWWRRDGRPMLSGRVPAPRSNRSQLLAPTHILDSGRSNQQLQLAATPAVTCCCWFIAHCSQAAGNWSRLRFGARVGFIDRSIGGTHSAKARKTLLLMRSL